MSASCLSKSVFRNYPFNAAVYIQRHMKIQSVPRSKHPVSVIKASQLMLYREITAVCSQFTQNINTLCGQNVELFDVKLVVHIVTSGL
jgi:hypothetical protein